MLPKFFPAASGIPSLALTLLAAGLVGCNSAAPSKAPPASSSSEHKEGGHRATTGATSDSSDSDHHGEEGGDKHGDAHGHKPGAHGGTIVSLGRDSYHVEAIVEKTGQLRLCMLGNDESRVVDIEAQDLIAYVKPEGSADSVQIEVKPQPQPGDAEGKASLFVGQLPDEALGKSVDITVPNIRIQGERFRMNFSTKSAEHSEEAMPMGADGKEARELYLTPGGIYTAADIEANGSMTASQKFKGLTSTHDLKPKAGDKICPVSLTKANPKFTWTVAGKAYEFCCPPCVDEFVALAKTNPEEIEDPEFYVKKEKASRESAE